jgi:glyoxylase-like metal-dependent hydrolase (beta-lactamase superfamily II)
VTLDQAAERIYRIPSVLHPRRFAQWLVVGDDRVLLVDSGVDGTIAEHVVPALGELGLEPEAITDVVISHADVDHYGGNSELRRVAPDAVIRAGAADVELIQSWDLIARERYGWYRQHGLDYPEAAWKWLQDAGGPDTRIDGAVEDGEQIDLGGVIVEIVALPGHSPGHLGVLHRPSNTAIVMDAVLERGLYTVDDQIVGPPPYGSVPDYRRTIARLRELVPERLGTSHYAPIEGDEAVQGFLERTAQFVDDLDACVRGQLSAEPQPLSAFWERANATVGPFPEMTVELARSVGAHLEHAVDEGVAELDESGDVPRWRAA